MRAWSCLTLGKSVDLTELQFPHLIRKLGFSEPCPFLRAVARTVGNNLRATQWPWGGESLGEPA